MSPGAKEQTDDLQLALEKIKNSNRAELSQYHQDLAKWARNVDRRYAWVMLAALWTMMAAVLGPYRIYGLIFAKVTNSGAYTREEASWPVSTIFTVENVIGPFVSIIAYYISYRKSMFIGCLLLVLCNGLASLSSSIIIDVLLIGVLQGIGYAFIFMPFMEIINSYFLRYRNLALGLALCGGTMSVFAFAPLFQWMLEAYPWRYSYAGLGAVSGISLLMIPLLAPNPRPEPPKSQLATRNEQNQRKVSTSSGMSRNTMRALAYQNSLRRQSTILINRQGLERQGSIISVNPFASSVGLERKISRVITDSVLLSSNNPNQNISNNKQPVESQHRSLGARRETTLSLSEVGDVESSEFELSIIWDVLKTPAFHFIWFNELLYFWIFSIYCLVMIDYATDRGCTEEQAETLLSWQSVGEIVGRLGLTVLVDLRFLSNKNVVVLVLLVIGSCLVGITQVNGYLWIAIITVSVSSFGSLLYILLNGLLVDYLGDRQVTIGYGMASCIGGVLMSFRPQAVGYCRDTLGTYDPLMMTLAACCAFAALLWIIEPLVTRLANRSKDQNQDLKPTQSLDA